MTHRITRHLDTPPDVWAPEAAALTPTEKAAAVRHADTTSHTLGLTGTRWCPTHRTHSDILDTHEETWHHAGRELGAVVTALTCGCQVQGRPSETGQTLSGAPYAGLTVAADPNAEKRGRYLDGWDD